MSDDVKFFDFSLIPANDDSTVLYYRGYGNCFVKNDCLQICRDSTVSFDTYFNCIPIEKLKKYTGIRELSFLVSFIGECELKLFALSENVNTEISCAKRADNSVSVDISDIPDTQDNGAILYLQISALSETVKISKIKVMYKSEIISDIKLAIITCTYKREAYITKNVAYFSDCLRTDERLDAHLFVVDNGATLNNSDIESNKVTLLHNINNGGSGGFAYGMNAVADDGSYTHFIIMDDDVSFDFAAFSKLYGFLACMKQEYLGVSVSGSMLFSDNPTVQFECGGYFSKDGVQTGYGYGFDFSDPLSLCDNEKPKPEINYGGWWLMCMPASYIYNGNYPLPFFMKYDDVEYSLRCKLQIITLNGFGVWHDCFEQKYNSASEYYNTRNYLHLRQLLDGHFSDKAAKKYARKQVLEKICRQQYNMAKAVIKGYNDYLKGLDYLFEIDAEENHKNIAQLNYSLLTEDELKEKYDIVFSQEKYDVADKMKFKQYMRPFLYGQLIPCVLCGNDYIVTDTFYDRKEMYFCKKRALHFDMKRGRGYITKKAPLYRVIKYLLMKSSI